MTGIGHSFALTRSVRGLCAALMSPVAIVNISSVAGIGALRGMTKLVAGQYGKDNIRANSMHPGFIETPMATAAGEQRRLREDMTMLRRIGQPREVAELVLFLASDASSCITASEHLVDAGLMAE